jgi:hypothetical protein
MGAHRLQRAQAADPAIFYDVENAGLSPTWSTDPEWIKSKVINLQKMMVQDTGHFAQLEDPGTLLVGIGIALGTYQASPAIFYTCEMCTAIPNIPDANNDGVVDSGDFVALSRNFNTVTPIAAPALPGDYSPVTFAWQTGDFNRDGRVNALDFNELAVGGGWRRELWISELNCIKVCFRESQCRQCGPARSVNSEPALNKIHPRSESCLHGNIHEHGPDR